MDRDRLVYKTFISVPYTLDSKKVEEHNLDTEDGIINLYFNEPDEILGITMSGESFGIDRYWIVNKLEKYTHLTEAEKQSVLKFFDDNNLSADDEYIIIGYDNAFQCTTVLDVYGNYIFEGDYVKDLAERTGIIFEVFYTKGSFKLKPVKYVLNGRHTPPIINLRDYDFQIVGNIIEGINED